MGNVNNVSVQKTMNREILVELEGEAGGRGDVDFVLFSLCHQPHVFPESH